MKNTIYLKITSDCLEIRHIEKDKNIIIQANPPFTTSRLLVGSFTNAQICISKGFKEIVSGFWPILKPRILVHPIEKVEGGLSEIEERILKELASSSGAKNIKIWLGHTLSDQEVIKIIENV